MRTLLSQYWLSRIFRNARYMQVGLIIRPPRPSDPQIRRRYLPLNDPLGDYKCNYLESNVFAKHPVGQTLENISPLLTPKSGDFGLRQRWQYFSAIFLTVLTPRSVDLIPSALSSTAFEKVDSLCFL
jgi:hypothetical protein